jgi:hypothetical protein
MMFRNSKVALTFSSIAVLVFLTMSLFGIYHISSENRKASLLLTEVNEADKRDAQTQSIKSLQNTAQADLSALENITLTDAGLVAVIENIEGVARALRLESKITSVDKVGEATEAEPQKIRIAIDSKGSWANNLSLLNSIENLPYRVMFENATFSKTESGWQSNIVFTLHSFK